jgi:hypothetical protein
MTATTRPLTMLLLLAACSIGTSGKSYPPAKGPAGAAVELGLAGKREVGGELLAMEDTTLLLVENRQLIRVHLTAITSLRAPKLLTRNLNERMRRRLRLISRYPQGVSPDLEARLLQAYGAPVVRRIP